MHDFMDNGLVMKRCIASKSRFNSYLPTLATFRRFQPPHPAQDKARPSMLEFMSHLYLDPAILLSAAVLGQSQK